MSKRFLQMSMVLAALTFSILACSFSFSSAKVENARLAKDKDGAQTTTQFSPQDTFYLVGSLANAPDDTLLKAIWTAVKVEGQTENTVIKEFEAAGGNGNFWFEISHDGGDWPRGQYKVDLFMNDELNQTLNFEVVGPDPTPTPEPAALETMPAATDPAAVPAAPAAISNLHTSKNDADTQPAVAFAQDSDIYVHFNLDAPDGQAQVYGALVAVAVEGLSPESVFTDIDQAFPAGAQWIHFSNTNPWPLGRYRVDVSVNGVLAQSVDLEVLNTNTTGARMENIYTALDENGQQPSTVFSTGAAISVLFTLVDAPEDTAVTGVLVARNVAGLDPDTYVTEASGQRGSGTYPITFTNDGPWPVGDYVIFLYLNGQFVQQVDLQVSG